MEKDVEQKAVVVEGADVSEGLAADSAVMTEALTETGLYVLCLGTQVPEL